MKTKFKINDRVKINCPVYYNGRTFRGIITKLEPSKQYKDIMQALIRIDGNTKSSRFGCGWLTLINTEIL